MRRTCARPTPLGAIARGLLAAAVGTLAMDLLWYWRYRRSGGQSGFTVWEFSVGLDDWEKASAPGKAGKRTLWDDLSAHLVYGLGTAAAFRWLAGR